MHNGVSAELLPGKTGEFTVVVDGRPIWDKFDTGRFPEPHEIISQL